MAAFPKVTLTGGGRLNPLSNINSPREMIVVVAEVTMAAEKAAATSATDPSE